MWKNLLIFILIFKCCYSAHFESWVLDKIDLNIQEPLKRAIRDVSSDVGSAEFLGNLTKCLMDLTTKLNENRNSNRLSDELKGEIQKLQNDIANEKFEHENKTKIIQDDLVEKKKLYLKEYNELHATLTQLKKEYLHQFKQLEEILQGRKSYHKEQDVELDDFIRKQKSESKDVLKFLNKKLSDVKSDANDGSVFLVAKFLAILDGKYISSTETPKETEKEEDYGPLRTTGVWVPWKSGYKIPEHAVVSNTNGNDTCYVIRALYNSERHPGRLCTKEDDAVITYGDRELHRAEAEILTHTNYRWVKKFDPENSDSIEDEEAQQNSLILAGRNSNGFEFHICRYKNNGNWIGGKVYFGICYYGLNRREKTETKEFEMLRVAK